MKLAIYGVSRSGKDFFITKLVELFKKNGVLLKHIKGSQTLNNLALQKYNDKFKSLNESQQNELRKEFVSFVEDKEKQFGNIVVDGHFSFYDSQNNIVSVFSDHDLNCYDKFFYLDTDSNKVVEYSRNSVGEKKNEYIIENQVDAWKNYEIESLEHLLINENKDLHIVKYQDDFSLQYVFDVVTKDKYNSYKTAYELVNSVEISNASTIILTDCDKTLSVDDTTNVALEFYQISSKPIKEIFYNDRYSPFQFALANKYYKSVNAFAEESIKHAVATTQLNKEIIDDLKSKTDCLILGITAGNTDIWNELLERCNLNATILPIKDTMSKYIKLFVAKILKEKGNFVVAIGDSLLDSLMLKEAHIGYIATGKGFRKNIDEFLQKNQHIRQLSYFDCKYDFIITDKSVSSIKALTNDIETEKLISTCKSNSGIDGKVLRLAHYNLGGKIASLIKSDFNTKDFAVIVMMRSGAPLGLGICDYFDCPVLFYDESNREKVLKEIKENENLAQRKFILCDAVINSGKSIENAINDLSLSSPIIATTVISDKYARKLMIPIYTARISQNSYVGTKQKTILGGNGPDTSDRLFKLI